MKKIKKVLASTLAVLSGASALCAPMGAYADDKISNVIVSEENELLSNVSGIGQTVDAWANNLLSKSTYGKALSSGTWYNDVTDVELLARIIYAENTSDTIDQIAITWIIVNRKNSSAFPDTYRGVVTQGSGSQFASLNSSNAKDYKNNSTNSGWRHATWLACAILTTSSESDYISLFGKPYGISDQLYFSGSNYFYNRCQMIGSQLQYNMPSVGYINTYDVVIVGSSLSDSHICTTKTSVNNYKSSTKNIYFNI